MKSIVAAIAMALTSVPLLAGGTHSHSHDHGKAAFMVGEPARGKPDRVFEVSMRDSMRFVFSPEFDGLREGEVIRFNLRNDGMIEHEFSIGTAEEHKKHAKMMREMPGMEHVDPNTISLKPGESGTLTWRFKGGDTVIFACNIPGHYEAGMYHQLAMLGSTQAN